MELIGKRVKICRSKSSRISISKSMIGREGEITASRDDLNDKDGTKAFYVLLDGYRKAKVFWKMNLKCWRKSNEKVF